MVDAPGSLLSGLTRWIDDAAGGLSRVTAPFRRRRAFKLVEREDGLWDLRLVRRRGIGGVIGKPLRFADGRFVGAAKGRSIAAFKGAKVEVALLASRFIFRPLELPRQAGDFLAGVVRAQIDRLTPWSASAAAFGLMAPVPLGPDRMVVTVAATARAQIAPLIDALRAQRADSIVVTTAHQTGASAAAAPITVFSETFGADRRVRALRIGLASVLALSVVGALAALGAWSYFGAGVDEQLAAAKHRIAMRRVELLSGRVSAADEATAALDARKRAAAPGVVVIEALSKTLPDDTYLTELRIENGKVQIAGLTRDAPALINLIEQSKRFSRATFFAPTTRAPTDGGERFHIEARIEPLAPAAQ